MSNLNVKIAEAFYTSMAEKNVEGMKKYLHADAQFTSPLVQIRGKDAYLEAVKNFTAFFKTLKIRAICNSSDQVMIVYDVDFPAPIGNLPSAALMNFKEELISKIELFFDARPFDK